MYIFFIFIIPYNVNVSILVIVGYAVVIIVFFMAVNLKDEFKNEFFEVKTFSENSIKIILLVLMSIAIFISPITGPKSIILWERVGILNHIRAIIFLIGGAFLPGANLYNIIFPKKNLHENFKVEPFLLKITLYPLISFSFIGVTVLILDQLGLIIDLFERFLFLTIVLLFLSDFVIQIIRKDNIKNITDKITISYYTLIILLLSLGILLISLGIHLGSPYLIPGDSWYGNESANIIGESDLNPIERRRNYGFYPMFWGYICFGLSVLSGLPFINTNALLAPFCYLFVNTIYLLMKSILFELKERYVILSTILILIFSGLFYSIIDLRNVSAEPLIIVCETSFSYKTFAYYLFFISLAIFIKTTNGNGDYNKKLVTLNDIRSLSFVAFFLIVSFMIYMLTLLMGIIFIIIYSILSYNKNRNLKLLSLFVIILTIFFVLFDIITIFFLSSSTFILVTRYINLKFLYQLFETIPPSLVIYVILSVLNFISITIPRVFSKFIDQIYEKFLNFEINSKNLFKIFYAIFTVFLLFEITIIVLEELILNFRLDNKIIFFYYLDKIFLNIGIIGILAVYLSYFCFKLDKKLFMILISWIFITFLIASSLIFIRTVESFSFFLKDIDMHNKDLMNHWFGRTWFYSIIPLCILCSIGLIEISEKVKNHRKFNGNLKKRKFHNILNLSYFTILIYLSFSNLVISGIDAGNKNENISDEEVQIISWMSENFPIDTKILLYDYDYVIRLGIMSSFSYGIAYIDKIFKSDYNYTELINEIDYLKENDIKYLLVSEDYLSECSDEVIFVKSYLKPYFYNETEYESDNYRILYAPYFD